MPISARVSRRSWSATRAPGSTKPRCCRRSTAGSRNSRCRSGCSWSMNCRATRWARCRRTFCATPTQRFTRSKVTRLCSFDNLIGAEQERLGNRKPDRPGGLEIDDHLEFRRLHHRKIGWLRAFPYPAGIDTGLTVTFCKMRSVAQKAADFGKLPAKRHRRQLVTQRQRRQLLAIGAEERIVTGKHGTGLLLHESIESRRDFLFGTGVQHDQRHPEPVLRLFDFL